VLMIMAGLGWVTFVSPALAHTLSPYHYIMGGIGEGLLTLWLLVMGVKSGQSHGEAAQGVVAR